ncbi:hypothetical protein HELRODRAFT_189229 [Helobdella robusta]|uniref:Uncharacterized protein n=1 Tax=Helobdella robusta TaxID=6412 RepID=T1FQU1_HELRO|nr:hypothetical protein HELRODRAFT_189229 [Helobdella robusta]ESN96411.1 hypothetical protein HELRODRAFT_189229 [Helobdella robusta]
MNVIIFCVRSIGNRRLLAADKTRRCRTDDGQDAAGGKHDCEYQTAAPLPLSFTVRPCSKASSYKQLNSSAFNNSTVINENNKFYNEYTKNNPKPYINKNVVRDTGFNIHDNIMTSTTNAINLKDKPGVPQSQTAHPPANTEQDGSNTEKTDQEIRHRHHNRNSPPPRYYENSNNDIEQQCFILSQLINYQSPFVEEEINLLRIKEEDKSVNNLSMILPGRDCSASINEPLVAAAKNS